MLVSGQIGLTSTTPPVLTGKGVPPSSFKGILGQQYFDTSTTPYVQYVYNGTSWISSLAATNVTISGTLTVLGLTTLAALTQVGTASINASGSASTTIGTGGTGAVSIGNATGGTSITGNTTLAGNLSLTTAGNKISIATGTNASIGTSAAMTAGTITISTTAVTASSKIFLTPNTPGGTAGILSAPTASIVAGTSFVINSSNNADTSTVNWWIIN